jgi:hypothetical protein
MAGTNSNIQVRSQHSRVDEGQNFEFEDFSLFCHETFT